MEYHIDTPVLWLQPASASAVTVWVITLKGVSASSLWYVIQRSWKGCPIFVLCCSWCFFLGKTGAACLIYCKVFSQKHSEHILHAAGKFSTETASLKSCCGNNGLSFKIRSSTNQNQVWCKMNECTSQINIFLNCLMDTITDGNWKQTWKENWWTKTQMWTAECHLILLFGTKTLMTTSRWIQNKMASQVSSPQHI